MNILILQCIIELIVYNNIRWKLVKLRLSFLTLESYLIMSFCLQYKVLVYYDTN